MPKMYLDRRQFLALTGATAATLGAATAARPAAAAEPLSLDPGPFTLGVASGQPDDSSVVLWTRWAPDPLDPDIPPQDVDVSWEISTDDAFTNIVGSGGVAATPALAHSVHVLADGLDPDRWYWYRFRTGQSASRVGRTRTLPTPGSHPQRLRFAIASCQSLAATDVYPAYGHMAEQDLDLVIHLGDYIYEDGGRADLDTYRELHARSKAVSQLRDAHASFPFVTVWDDHEILNNWSRDEDLVTRRTNGFKAYYEHLPMRTAPDGPDWPVHHEVRWGDLATFFILDTRQYRSDQADRGFIRPRHPGSFDQDRAMLGGEQEQWLFDELENSQAQWNVLAQQTMMASFDYDTGEGESINHDQWDGYMVARDRFLDFVRNTGPSNPVILTGDWHSHWVNDILADYDNPDSEVVATEFVGTSISSDCGWDQDVKDAWHVNPHVKFCDGRYRGYMQFDVTHDRWLATLRAVENPQNAESPVHTIAQYQVDAGEPGAKIPGGVYASTGRSLPTMPNHQDDGGFDDITMGNDLIAMTVADALTHGQLGDTTKGKPVDLVATGHIDRLDWINLPYVAANQPGDADGWNDGPVKATTVEVMSPGPDQAVVKASGRAGDDDDDDDVLRDIAVVTTYTVEPHQPWITAESVFTNEGSAPITAWIGDVIDHDGAGQRSGVAGHGTISGSAVAEYAPTGSWIGMTGDDPQTYGLIYEDSDFAAFGSGLWIQSQRRVTIQPGASWRLRRRIVAAGTVGDASPWGVLDVLSRPPVFAGTGYHIPGPVSEGQHGDITMGNELVVMTIANVTEDDENQLRGATRGKPLDMAATGFLDQLDWINLPYVVTDEPPSGGDAYHVGLVDVPAGGIDIRSDGTDGEAVVDVTGTARDADGIKVVTTFTVKPGQPWVHAVSTFTNLRTDVRELWIGDVIDYDGAGQRSGVAGRGTITGSQLRRFATGGWIGMAGDDGQTYGLVYRDAPVSGSPRALRRFTAYGSGLWMQSQFQITLAAGESYPLPRRIVAIDNGGASNPWAVLDHL